MRNGFLQVRRVSKANPAHPGEGCDEPAEPPVIQDKTSKGNNQTAGKLKQNISQTQQY